nr:MAG TPA: hypothetical protein [Caudoviricetes sp.]
MAAGRTYRICAGILQGKLQVPGGDQGSCTGATDE